MSFQNILSIRELDGIWQVRAIVEFTWFDKRLKMQNLKKNSNFNVLSKDEIDSIWTPQIIFSNTKEESRIKFDDKAVVRVIRGPIKWTPANLDLITPAHLFEGKDSRIVYARTYDSELYCDFDLKFFPIDKQSCSMKFKVPESLIDFVNLKPAFVDYGGPSKLAQFSVQSFSFSKDGNGEISFEVTIRRMFFYHLISVYIPSSCLLLITLMTSYINVTHFEPKIMVHLTANVIMYTLFQAVSINLPQVSNNCQSTYS